ncbi:hypothetical protein R2R35_18540 [Anaerocolumna sp. AGMB13020]|uniref:hypothetical protein n=1 Tax=Anaerocolumna sp. AGMB13020 TaxID=3081750 RepID=UPI0029545B27|nr:hypothetical protein [Anaerocolumna sp. AGMB13020]WOO35780.1 hypothetical protein R2R35_18540 [Anaerocolumna sp. AGMB13020]
MKSIFEGIMVSKVDKYSVGCYSDSEFIDIEKEYAYANSTDISDIVELNIGYKDGTLRIIKELINNTLNEYTHIVEDRDGFLFAIAVKDGDYSELYLT